MKIPSSVEDKKFLHLALVMLKNWKEFSELSDPRKFGRWLKRNMHIYNEFERYSLMLKKEGKRNRYSTRAIIHRLTWDSYFSENGNSGFKLDHNNTPYISRLLMLDNPELKGMFRTKMYRRR